MKATREQQREYDKHWRNNHRKEYNSRRLRKNREMWGKIILILGDKCVGCGKQVKKRRISFHEIYGKSHKENPYYVLKHIEDFLPLCSHCHSSLHTVARHKKLIELLMKILGDNFGKM